MVGDLARVGVKDELAVPRVLSETLVSASSVFTFSRTADTSFAVCLPEGIAGGR